MGVYDKKYIVVQISMAKQTDGLDNWNVECIKHTHLPVKFREFRINTVVLFFMYY